MTEKKIIANFNYEYSPEYKEYYATGARGGIINGYHYHLEFYRETQHISTQQQLVETSEGRRVEDISDVEPPVIQREFLFGLNLSFHAAFELYQWLGAKLSDMANIQSRTLEALRESVPTGETMDE